MGKFPELTDFPSNPLPSPYARQMGASIVTLLRLFAGKVPDAESNACVLELAVTLDRWSAGHAIFDEVRDRLLTAKADQVRVAQYGFEESCLKAMYNESQPDDPFDSVSPYWVVPGAIGLAPLVGVSLEGVVKSIYPDGW